MVNCYMSFKSICSYCKHAYYAPELVRVGFRYLLSPIKYFSKRKCVMRHGMSKLYELKVRRYTYFIVELNEYLDILYG